MQGMHQVAQNASTVIFEPLLLKLLVFTIVPFKSASFKSGICCAVAIKPYAITHKAISVILFMYHIYGLSKQDFKTGNR